MLVKWLIVADEYLAAQDKCARPHASLARSPAVHPPSASALRPPRPPRSPAPSHRPRTALAPPTHGPRLLPLRLPCPRVEWVQNQGLQRYIESKLADCGTSALSEIRVEKRQLVEWDADFAAEVRRRAGGRAGGREGGSRAEGGARRRGEGARHRAARAVAARRPRAAHAHTPPPTSPATQPLTLRAWRLSPPPYSPSLPFHPPPPSARALT